jgi:hypothetical protein
MVLESISKFQRTLQALTVNNDNQIGRIFAYGWLFALLCLGEIIKVSKSFGLLFSTDKGHYFDENGLGSILFFFSQSHLVTLNCQPYQVRDLQVQKLESHFNLMPRQKIHKCSTCLNGPKQWFPIYKYNNYSLHTLFLIVIKTYNNIWYINNDSL